MLSAQLLHLEKPGANDDVRSYLENKTKSVAYALSPNQYKAESYVNERLSLTLSDLLIVARSNTIYCGRNQDARFILTNGKETKDKNVFKTAEGP